MTITTEPAVLSYSGDDATVAFAITWKYFATTDVVATLRSSAGAETTWVLNTDYTLSAAGVSTGGTLTATTAPASGTTLVINLDPPNTQTSRLPRGGAFPSSTVEDALDQAAQRDAKLEILWDRALRVPKTDLRTGSELELPIDTTRASKYLKFDGNGVATAAAGTATLGETGLLSQDTESELTIASGSVTPTVSTHSIDTEGDAATDNLDNIVTTNLEDGRFLLIRGNNASRAVTVRDAQGSAGQIITATGENVTLLGTTNSILLQRRGSDWYEVQLGLSLGQGQGADIASATALSVDVPGTFHDVTGSVTITSFDAVAIGTTKILQFDGALTLTHHATDLILPTAANITTAAGDIGTFYEYASGDWRCTSYFAAAGGALLKGVLINSSGDILVNTTTTSTSTPKMEIVDSSTFCLSLSDVTTDATSKTGRIIGRHYTNSEEGIFLIGMSSDGTNNTIQIGGSSNSLNAATVINFYTGATNTTLGGSAVLALALGADQSAVFGGLVRRTVTNTITAGTTQTQAGATALTTDINRVITVAVASDGVKLPAANSGQYITIRNNGANNLKIWPASGDAIDGGSVDAADSNLLAAATTRNYFAIDSTTYYTG